MTQRPVLRLSRTIGEMLLDGVALGLLGFLAVTLITNWSALPESIPIHFGFLGKSDATGDKTLLLVIPFFALCSLVAFSALRRIPHRLNFVIIISEENAERQYRNALMMMAWIKVEIVTVFAYVGWSMVQIGLGRAHELGPAFVPGMLILVFGTIGIFLFRSSRMK